MKLSLVIGRFYLGIARLFMPPLEQALRRRRDFVGGGLPKGRTWNPDWEAYATRSFRRFFRTVEFCFWNVPGKPSRSWRDAAMLSMGGQAASQLDGMVPMHLLMSAFHWRPGWRLAARWRQSG
ncbi:MULTISPECIES: hypothetical protein [unclassified Mesorhizobium]|uniref:hypothetical protein n=1 Tax=unclassified Mesorhizobium TaxID=325217 RepID=UPI0003CE17DC|nr:MULTISPECIES: hypothetical protein [unclassified Mesorhizobium]ESY58333.1 hypothetical protein X745_05265 [Mesorhizobium sp. LNJC374B00]ESY59468.1 hypothetical protein X744_13910 [Mesorhizobium sp. LNJC372A00]WJI79701.1 hypothetical protein NLY34_22960 [Mesorhizobium sp. C374B]WJI86236.1 hypothetical protein NLY42_25355 [Mesorhizobium sp. C372A]